MSRPNGCPRRHIDYDGRPYPCNLSAGHDGQHWASLPKGVQTYWPGDRDGGFPDRAVSA